MWSTKEEITQFGSREGDMLVCETGEGGCSGIVKVKLDSYMIQKGVAQSSCP